jgi:hypothetical protein
MFPAFCCALLFLRLRRQNHISAAPKAKPTMGPMTTPAIQVLLFDGGLRVDGCSVGRDVLEVEEEELEIGVEAVATLEDVGTADVEPLYA